MKSDISKVRNFAWHQ